MIHQRRKDTYLIAIDLTKDASGKRRRRWVTMAKRRLR
jgi:hypothetical protein